MIIKSKYKMPLSILLIVLPLLLFVASLAHAQDCETLSDGKYRVRFTKQFGGATYFLLLDGKRFTEIREGQQINGTVELNENCTLRLDYKIKWDTTNELQRMLSKAHKPSFKFDKTSGRRLRFRLTGYAGPHVTAGAGTFIKIE